AEAKSLSLPLQFRFVAPSCSAACSDALAVACARPVLVLPSSSLCIVRSTSPGFDCRVIALALAFVTPPLRLGSCQLSRLAQESTVFGFKPRRLAASRAPNSIAKTRTLSRSGGLVSGSVVSFCMLFSLVSLKYSLKSPATYVCQGWGYSSPFTLPPRLRLLRSGARGQDHICFPAR